jgi:hypothetical protein
MALPVNLKDTLTVARFDYRNLVRSAPGVIFLIVYLLVVVQLGTISIDMIPLGVKSSPMCKLPEGSAPTKVKDKIRRNLPPFANVSPAAWRVLECDRPVVMSVFFLFSLLLVPCLVLLLSFNQVAGYLHRKSIRYILPKTGRLELYLGLFLSNLKFFTVVSGAVTVAVTLGWLIVGRNIALGTVLLFSTRIFIALWLSAVPLIAFMSMVAAATARPIWAFFIGFFGYLVLDIVAFFAAYKTEYAKVVFYLLPLEAKWWFAYPSLGRFLGAAALMVCYTAAYLAIGWVFLRRRNV